MQSKNPHATALGSLGGKARKAKLTKEELSAIGKKAVQAGIIKRGQKRRKENSTSNAWEAKGID